MAEKPVEAGDPYRKRPLAVEAQLAPFGGPIGMTGVAADLALIPQLSLAAGAGLGSASPQLAAAIRPRIPVSPLVALEFSAGYSYGSYERTTRLSFGGESARESFVGGSWVNADAGVQIRFEPGIMLRFFLGMSQLVACAKAEHKDGITLSAVPQARWPLLPYWGMAVGFAFGLG